MSWFWCQRVRPSDRQHDSSLLTSSPTLSAELFLKSALYFSSLQSALCVFLVADVFIVYHLVSRQLWVCPSRQKKQESDCSTTTLFGVRDPLGNIGRQSVERVSQLRHVTPLTKGRLLILTGQGDRWSTRCSPALVLVRHDVQLVSLGSFSHRQGTHQNPKRRLALPADPSQNPRGPRAGACSSC